MKYKQGEYEIKINELIASKGGKRKNNEAIQSTFKIEVICSNGHNFKITPAKIMQNRWCAECRKIPFEKVQSFVENKGGKIKGDYVKMISKMEFECSLGHKWISTPASIMLNNTWCPICAKCIKISISEFDKIANDHGGKCLSTEYNTQQDKLQFICSKGHIWETMAKHIKAGHWCPRCHVNIGEEICRKVFENIFEGYLFPKYRSNWLVNENGYFLELDGYCAELGIAFEHQGKQHYGYDIFNIGPVKMKNYIQNDIIKKKLCLEKGIKLIEIPQLFDFTKPKDFPTFLQKSFSNYNIVEYNFKKLLSTNISRK